MKNTLLLLAFALGLALMGDSCTSAQQKFVSETVVPLADLGLNVAAAAGKISPGQNIAIQHGLAVVTTPGDSASAKAFTLAQIGLTQAVNDGVVKPGDALVITEATAIIQRAVIPDKNPPLTSVSP